MPFKKCRICEQTKALDSFYKREKSKDGYCAECKECRKQYAKILYKKERPRFLEKAKIWRLNNRERIREATIERRERSALYYQENKHKYFGRYKETHAKWHSKNPLAIKAHNAIHKEINKNSMPKATEVSCSECGGQAKIYHHHLGYEPENWLSVIPLCYRCHRKIHSENKNLNLADC